MKKRLKYKNKELVFIWLGYFTLNVIVSLAMQCAQITPDEINPLSISANLAGYDWHLASEQYLNYYGYLQSILYVPFFCIIKDGIILYKAILCVNAFIISFIPIFAYCIATQIFKIKDNRTVILVVLMSSLQPAYLVLSKRAWNESMVSLLAWAAFYLVGLCVENNRRILVKSILLGVCLACGYMTHGRFIAIIATVLIIDVLFRALLKRRMISSLSCYAALAFLLLIDFFIKSKVMVILWNNKEVVLRNTLSDTIRNILSRGLSVEVINEILRAFSGDLFYLLFAGIGFLAIGFVILIRLLREIKSTKENNMVLKEAVLGVYSYLCIFFALVINVLFFVSEYHISEEYYFIYGRYTEYLLGPILLLTGIFLNNHGIRKRELAECLTLLIMSGVYTFLLENQTLFKKRMVDCNVYTLLSFAPEFSLIKKNIYFGITIMIFILMCVVLCALLFRNKVKTAFFYITILFLVSFYNTSKISMIHDSREIYRTMESTYNFFNSLEAADSSIVRDYAIVLFEQHSTSYQVAMPYGRFYYMGADNFLDKESFIVSKTGLPELEMPEQLFEISTSKQETEEKIYIYGSGLKEKMSALGYIIK